MTPASSDYSEDMQARSQDGYSSSTLTFVLCVQLRRGGWRNNNIISTRCGDQSLGAHRHTPLTPHLYTTQPQPDRVFYHKFTAKNLEKVAAEADCTLTRGVAAPGRSGGSMLSW